MASAGGHGRISRTMKPKQDHQSTDRQSQRWERSVASTKAHVHSVSLDGGPKGQDPLRGHDGTGFPPWPLSAVRCLGRVQWCAKSSWARVS
jgi:hypothetical protein